MPRPLFLGLLLLTALRLVVALAGQPTPVEAELWLAGQYPAAGYVAHGPWPVWMMRLGTMVAGDGMAGLRLFAPWLMLAASWLAWRLAAGLFGASMAAWLVAVLQVTPLVNVAATRAEPGAWALVWSLLALWWWWQALHRASPWSWQWPASGVAMGLAALSDVAGWWLAPGLLCLLLAPRRWRRQLARPGPWLAWALMALVLVPWLLWQRDARWLPLRSWWFEGGRGLSFGGFFQWALRVTLVFSPLLLAGLLWAVSDGLKAGLRSWLRRRHGGLRRDDPLDQKDGRVFLLAAVSPAALAAVGLALWGRGTLSLVALPGFVALVLLVARWLEAPFVPTLRRLIQNATLILAAAYSLPALHSDLFRHLGLRWPYALDPTASIVGWSPMTRQLQELSLLALENEGGTGEPRRVFFLTDSTTLAATLSYHLRPVTWKGDQAGAIRGLTLIADGLPCQRLARTAVDSDFSFWPSYADQASGAVFTGQNALFIQEGGISPAQLSALRAQFERLDDLGSLEARRGGLPVRRFSCLVARNFRGPFLPR